MKLKLKEIVEINNIFSQIGDKELPSLVSFKISHFVLKTTSEMKSFSEERTKLFEKYGEKSGEQYNVKKENIEEFQMQFNALLDNEVEVNISEFDEKDFEDCNLKPNQAFNLMALFKEKEG